jgi:hypothetical protein
MERKSWCGNIGADKLAQKKSGEKIDAKTLSP